MHRGDLTINVSKPGTPFHVDTPTAEMFVHGTVFRVVVAETGSTLVQVTTGRVRVLDRFARTNPRSLDAGSESFFPASDSASLPENPDGKTLATMGNADVGTGISPLPALIATHSEDNDLRPPEYATSSEQVPSPPVNETGSIDDAL